MTTAQTKLQDSKGSDWNALAAEYKNLSSGPGPRATSVLLERLNATLPFSHATAILDNGCGPGPILSKLIAEYGAHIPASATLLAADFSEGMIQQVEGTKAEGIQAGSKLWERVETRMLNAMDMQGIPDASQSHVLAGWVYFMTPDPKKCLSETLRVLTPGGVLACTSWKGSEWIDVMDEITKLRSEKVMPIMPVEWVSVDGVMKVLEDAGFRDVVAEEIPVEMQFEKAEVLADMIWDMMPIGAAMVKDMSEDEVRTLKKQTVARIAETSVDRPGVLYGTAMLGIGKK